MPTSWRGMRVRHLITMSSGLPEDFGGPGIPYDKDVVEPSDDASLLRLFFGLPLGDPVGTRYSYSSPNYAMLGLIVSKIAGEPFPQFVRERIFIPAGMTESSYIDNSAVVPHRAEGYRKDRDGGIKKGRYLGQYLHARPDDGVLTTAVDLAKWIIALEQQRIVKDPQKLWEATVSDAGVPLDYSYGWITDTWLGHRRQEHSGGYRTGFHTFVARYPDDDLSLVVLTNCDYSSIRDYVGAITRQYLHDVPDPAVERTKADADPSGTERAIAALRHVLSGSVDTSVMTADAVEPIGTAELQDFLKAAGPFTYAGRARLPGRGLNMHGHVLVDYVTLCTTMEGQPFYVTLYRNAAGKIVYLEESN